MHHILHIVKCLLPVISLFFPVILHSAPWDTDSIKSIYAGRQLYPIEGVWEFPGGGAKIAIVQSTATTFDIYLLDSPRLDVRPGTLIGNAVMTARSGYYDGTLEPKGIKGYGKSHRDRKLKSETVTFTVNKEGALEIKPYKTGKSVSFRRWIYYFLKVSIVDNGRRPDDLDGALRVYPETPRYPVRL